MKGLHGEVKTWHGLARAVRRGPQSLRVQALLTAAAVNLKRLAAALAAVLAGLLIAALTALAFVAAEVLPTDPDCRARTITPHSG